ncbi:hypothetical protein [Streptomyces carpinensis]|uniref:Lipoprotein n=1 Tax=Streptomyces carpinensis TaxID=66369 RepID=A0ABV1W3Y9_9ACTN|nr:hypothetical protein [Streptomyces carpinensis]
MRETPTTAVVACLIAAGATACSKTPTDDAGTQDEPAAASSTLTAHDAFTKIAGTVSSAKLSGTVTAESDPNHLLGHPSKYTSKITFEDSHVAPGDVEGTRKGDVDRGGAIEVFGSRSDAKARAEYIQTVTKSMPALAEYDHLHGRVLVRVSHHLTPKQAAACKSVANELS